MNAHTWHSRPFIRPADTWDDANAAARQYLEWEIARGMPIHEPYSYEAEGECGYRLRHEQIIIPHPNALVEDWRFSIEEIRSGQNLLRLQ